MRLLQLRVGTDRLDEVLSVLDDEDVDPVVVPTDDEASPATQYDGETYLVEFPLPTEAVDRIRDRLGEVGFDEDHLVIGNAETAKTPNYGTLVERYVEGNGAEEERVSNEEIRTKARDLNPQPTTYYGMTVLSSFVATAGLLLDSPALVVGSMVIAPQIGAALTGSVGAALGDGPMFTNGLRSTVVGLGVAVVAAALLGWGLKTAHFIPPALNVTTVQQIASRTSPGLLTILVALCAGAAGGFGLATELPVSIVGVAVAAATVPAAAAVGIGIAWGIPVVTVGAATFLTVNIAGIVFAGTASLWYLGYRPSFWTDRDTLSARLRVLSRNRTTWLALGVALVTVLGPGALVGAHVAFENQATGAVQNVLDRGAYQDLELVSVQVDFETVVLGDSPPGVTVTVRRPTNQPSRQLAPTLRREISDATGEDVEVTVLFEESQRTTSTAG